MQLWLRTGAEPLNRSSAAPKAHRDAIGRSRGTPATLRATLPVMRRLAVVLMLALLAAACGSSGSSDDAAGSSADAADAAADAVATVAGAQLQSTLIPDPEATGYQGAVLPLAVPKPDFTLTDTAGAAYSFHEATADADVTFLYFGYTTCPDICPTHMAAVASALRAAPELRDRIEVVFVSVDPTRDEPRLQEYLDGFGDGFVGLTGSPEEVNRVMTEIGLHPTAIDAGGDYPPAHPTNIIVFTGDEARIAYPFGVHGGAIAQDLPLLVDDPVFT